jgi:hypothetical protein
MAAAPLSPLSTTISTLVSSSDDALAELKAANGTFDETSNTPSNSSIVITSINVTMTKDASSPSTSAPPSLSIDPSSTVTTNVVGTPPLTSESEMSASDVDATQSLFTALLGAPRPVHAGSKMRGCTFTIPDPVEPRGTFRQRPSFMAVAAPDDSIPLQASASARAPTRTIAEIAVRQAEREQAAAAAAAAALASSRGPRASISVRPAPPSSQAPRRPTVLVTPVVASTTSSTTTSSSSSSPISPLPPTSPPPTVTTRASMISSTPLPRSVTSLPTSSSSSSASSSSSTSTSSNGPTRQAPRLSIVGATGLSELAQRHRAATKFRESDPNAVKYTVVVSQGAG